MARGARVAVMPNNFLTELDVRYLEGSWLNTKWLVLSDFTYLLHPDGEEFVRVGRGFITDFASIPIGVRLIYRSPGGDWDKPAVIHDCLYKSGYVERADGTCRVIDRAEADRIFFDAMTATGTGWWAKRPIYRGVRAGGMFAWNKHRRAEVVPPPSPNPSAPPPSPESPTSSGDRPA